ncbi:hypothetical protein AB5J55_42645 [Streptomyces sp. R11]|uniref:Uncharacterized protein n=1 Tax=Streptomyces sp. R11 TaxID=3238625 RepID=A0AB39ND25_9ACTN
MAVPLAEVVGLVVVLSSAHRGEDAWLIWVAAVLALAGASGAAFVHGLRRWAEFREFGGVSWSAVVRPLLPVYVIGVVLLVPLLLRDFDAWRGAVLIVLASAGLSPAAATMVAVGRTTAVRADVAAAAPGLQVDHLIRAGRLLQSLLSVGGGIVALLVVVEATSQRMTGHVSVETTLVFGANSSALVAIVYVPIAARLRQRGMELVDICHPLGPVGPGELADVLDQRSRIEAALRVDRTVFSDIQTNLAVVGPLLAAAASVFLSR